MCVKNMNDFYFHTIHLALDLDRCDFKGEVQSRITINSKERINISLQIGAKMMKIG